MLLFPPIHDKDLNSACRAISRWVLIFEGGGLVFGKSKSPSSVHPATSIVAIACL
mgnify:FL=1